MKDVRRLLAVTWFLYALVLPAAGFAQVDSLAESLFRQARTEMEKGDFDSACPKFAESFQLQSTLGALINLAMCEERRGRVATAWAKLRQFLEIAPPDDRRVPLARRTLQAIEPKIPRLDIVVTDAAKASVVRLDGVTLGPGAWASPLAVDPGSHRLDLVAPDGRTRTADVDLAEGDVVRVELSLPPSADATPSHATKPTVSVRKPRAEPPLPPVLEPRNVPVTARRRTPVAAYVLFGAGGASWVAATVLGIMTAGKAQVAGEHCPEKACDDEGYAARESGRRLFFATVATASAGAIALGSGVYLTVRASRSGSDSALGLPLVQLRGSF